MFTYAAVVSGRSGSHVPGRSAAYENQALSRPSPKKNRIFFRGGVAVHRLLRTCFPALCVSYNFSYMQLLSVLIGSLYCLCLLWLARAITVVLVLWHSTKDTDNAVNQSKYKSKYNWRDLVSFLIHGRHFRFFSKQKAIQLFLYSITCHFVFQQPAKARLKS